MYLRINVYEPCFIESSQEQAFDDSQATEPDFDTGAGKRYIIDMTIYKYKSRCNDEHTGNKNLVNLAS